MARLCSSFRCGSGALSGRAGLALALALALLHGLWYALAVPPWQHYDEPSHFEYVRLIAERGRLPRPGDLDPVLRQEIAASMRDTGFWQQHLEPDYDPASGEPPSIGVSELPHPPAYYALLALPQFLLGARPVETQLRVARLCSVLLSLVVVACSWGIAAEALPGRRWLPLAAALCAALLPALADRFSGVNNDIGAAASASLALWACVRLARQPSLRRAVAAVALAGLCTAVKSTAGAAALSGLLAAGLACVPRRLSRVAILGAALALATGTLAAFDWQHTAAGWYSRAPAGARNRSTGGAAVGQSALALSAEGRSSAQSIMQELPWREGYALRGRTVTLGAWVRVPSGRAGFVVLDLEDGAASHWHRIPATPEWQFVSVTATLSREATGLAVVALVPRREGAAQAALLDGLILAEGEFRAGQPPQFDSADAVTARWGGRAVRNLLRNGSAEAAFPALRPWLGSRTLFRQPASLVWQSFLDWRRTGWALVPELRVLFTSFWGGFGWNHLSLPGPAFYPLALLTVAALVGCAWSVAVRLVHGPRPAAAQARAWAVLGTALLVAWGGAVLRVHPLVITGRIHWPVARYADAAIVPTLLVLCVGLGRLVPRRWARAAAWTGLTGLVALAALAWVLVLGPAYLD